MTGFVATRQSESDTTPCINIDNQQVAYTFIIVSKMHSNEAILFFL